jgi:FlaG/FlaF family flagellin (archaellin)
LSLFARIRARSRDERGFALIIAVALMTLITGVSLTLITFTQGEDQHSRRDQAKDGSFQAAEAGTNAYLSDLTESNVFFNSYMAKGEATRTDSGNVAHANNCSVSCSNLAWSSGTTWTYKTALASDTGWLSLGNGYDYLIRVYPPNTSLTGLAQVITRIDVTGRPHGGTDPTKWHTIETMIRPSSLTDFQAFVGSNISYAVGATTTGPIFAGEDNSGNKASITHNGTAKANLYAEGTVGGATTYLNGAKKYDQNTSPTALCKLNNCAPVPFSTFSSTISTVQGAAAGGGISLAATDNTNAALSGQSPAYHVDAWKLVFQSNGTVLVSSCKKSNSGGSSPTTYELYQSSTPPVCGTAVSKPVPAVGAIYAATSVLVSGVVHGKVTVASTGDIIYGGNLTYAANGSDVIGLEAQGEIDIATWGLDSSGNILIYGAQLALNGQWTDDSNCSTGSNYANCHSSSSTCTPATACTMTFYGSSALYGVTGGGQSAIGLSNLFKARNYNYDSNLIFLPPPWFPTLGNAFTILVQREM